MLEKLRESKNQTITPLYRISDNSGTLNNRWTLKAVQLYSIHHLTTTVLSVRFGVGVSLLLAPARADKRGPKASLPLVENAGIQPAICKRVPAGAPAGAGSYWKHCHNGFKRPWHHSNQHVNGDNCHQDLIQAKKCNSRLPRDLKLRFIGCKYR